MVADIVTTQCEEGAAEETNKKKRRRRKKDQKKQETNCLTPAILKIWGSRRNIVGIQRRRSETVGFKTITKHLKKKKKKKKGRKEGKKERNGIERLWWNKEPTWLWF